MGESCRWWQAAKAQGSVRLHGFTPSPLPTNLGRHSSRGSFAHWTLLGTIVDVYYPTLCPIAFSIPKVLYIHTPLRTLLYQLDRTPTANQNGPPPNRWGHSISIHLQEPSSTPSSQPHTSPPWPGSSSSSPAGNSPVPSSAPAAT